MTSRDPNLNAGGAVRSCDSLVARIDHNKGSTMDYAGIGDGISNIVMLFSTGVLLMLQRIYD